jgi:hypothetical protein
MKNEDPKKLTDEYIHRVWEKLRVSRPDTDHDVINDVLLADREVMRQIVHDPNLEKWRGVYSFYIPGEVLLDMLRTIAWATMDETYGEPTSLLSFHPISDPEDSYFQVLDDDNDPKTSLDEAIKKAYFRLQDKQKEERRQTYLKLKEEFESEVQKQE